MCSEHAFFWPFEAKDLIGPSLWRCGHKITSKTSIARFDNRVQKSGFPCLATIAVLWWPLYSYCLIIMIDAEDPWAMVCQTFQIYGRIEWTETGFSSATGQTEPWLVQLEPTFTAGQMTPSWSELSSVLNVSWFREIVIHSVIKLE